jgi:hypothetical protein
MMPEVYGRVRAAWIILCAQHEHEQDWNPVEKVVLQVHRYENQLVIGKPIAIPGGGGNNVGVGVGGNNDPLVLANRAVGNQQQLGIITKQLHQLKQDLVQGKMENLHAKVNCEVIASISLIMSTLLLASYYNRRQQEGYLLTDRPM